MHYTVTVGFEQDIIDNQGKPKVKKAKMLVEADSVEEATIVVNRYIAEDMRSAEVLGVMKTPFEELITIALNPKLYRNKATA